MKYLFIDESGDHNLPPERVDPSAPLFLLMGTVFDENPYLSFQQKIRQFKYDVFKNENVILHALEINRPREAKQKDFLILENRETRKIFYDKLNSLIKSAAWQAIGVSIHKPGFKIHTKKLQTDPYFFSFNFLIKNFLSYLNDGEEGRIIVEKRDRLLDDQLILAWEQSKYSLEAEELAKMKSHGTDIFTMVEKSPEYTGVELSDLVAYRLQRHLNRKPIKPNGNELDIDLILKKLLLAQVPPKP